MESAGARALIRAINTKIFIVIAIFRALTGRMVRYWLLEHRVNMKVLTFSKQSLACALALLSLSCATFSQAQETPAAPAPASAPASEATAPADATATPRKPSTKDDGMIRGLSTADPNQIGKFETRVGLDDAQKAKLKTALDTYRDAIDGIKNDNGISAKERPAKNAEAYKALVISVNDILTDEQREKMVQMRKEWQAKKAEQELKAKEEKAKKDAEKKNKKKKGDEEK